MNDHTFRCTGCGSPRPGFCYVPCTHAQTLPNKAPEKKEPAVVD